MMTAGIHSIPLIPLNNAVCKIAQVRQGVWAGGGVGGVGEPFKNNKEILVTGSIKITLHNSMYLQRKPVH